MEGERIRRPTLDRTQPYRTFARVWGASTRSSQASEEEREDSAASENDAEGDGEGGFIEDGVRAAYTVLDAYLRHGRRVARKIGRVSWPTMMSDRRLRQRQARILQLASELTANYFDLLGFVTESLLSGYGSDRESQDPRYAAEATDDRAPSMSVVYDIASVRPAVVQLEFQPGKATSRITSHGLRSLDQGCPPIHAAFEARGQHGVVVKVRVPTDQPPGLYNAILLDSDTGRIVGSMSLELK